jgi:DNA polymerase III subunit alpha
MADIANIGLLKMDVLGLANLTTLSQARKIIRRSRGEVIDYAALPMDDAATFSLLASGETSGVFQLEGTGMRRYIKDLKPTTFSDIAAMVALYRPGPMEHIPTFIDAKHGRKEIVYPHPALKNILEETYGVIVYQDQVLFIVREFAGYSLGQADIFRKAMGKKIADVMVREKQNFISGAVEKGYAPKVAEDIYALIEPFAGYAFNKAHSVSYAMIAYQTAYLKANYAAEYLTALLQTNTGVSEKVATAIAECRRLNIKVLGPDINRSQVAFWLDQDDDGDAVIRFGLGAVKNVGVGAVSPIIAAREKDGVFKSVEDFCRRTDLRKVNRRVLESLIKTGAFDDFGERGLLLANIERVLSLSQQEQQRRESGQTTMFDLWGESTPVPLASLQMEGGAETVATRDKLAWEKELTGVYLSEHPFSIYAQKLGDDNYTPCGQIDEGFNGKAVTIAGQVVSTRRIFTKDNKEFISVVMEDLGGSVEVTAWPRIYEGTAHLWLEGKSLVVRGKVRVRGDRVQVYADTVSDLADETAAAVRTKANGNGVKAPVLPRRRLVIAISGSEDEAADIFRLNNIVNLLREFPGNDEVSISVDNGGQVTNLRLTALFTGYNEALRGRLAEMVGDGSIRLEELAGNV